MKRICGLFILGLTSTSLYAHGDIEKISCENKTERIKLEGVETKTSNTLQFRIERGGKLIGEKSAPLILKDIVNSGSITEEISIDLAPHAKAVLLVPEIYELEVRPGTGKLSFLSDQKEFDLSCEATY